VKRRRFPLFPCSLSSSLSFLLFLRNLNRDPLPLFHPLTTTTPSRTLSTFNHVHSRPFPHQEAADGRNVELNSSSSFLLLSQHQLYSSSTLRSSSLPLLPHLLDPSFSRPQLSSLPHRLRTRSHLLHLARPRSSHPPSPLFNNNGMDPERPSKSRPSLRNLPRIMDYLPYVRVHGHLALEP